MAGGDFPLSHLHASQPQDRIFLTLVNVDQSALGRGLGGEGQGGTLCTRRYVNSL